MKTTEDKIYDKLAMAYYWAQLIFSICVILFGAIYAIRCMIQRTDAIFPFLFGIMSYVAGYKLLFRASVKDLIEARKRHA